ncbi:MAG: hypothetical protein CLLPBCKN_004582 [Chroococcidiopsis cubana SAG 39.79]|nr:VapE domain-containing protein [Chroococcidiopsis cubana]MDZ4875186.1 hypothetical protein [Chroococcidiopsis cubana SAG 39.79]
MSPAEYFYPQQWNGSTGSNLTSSQNGKFQRSSRRNPCPICSRTKDADCSWNDGVFFCHTHVDHDAGIPGYVYRGATKDGMWGQYFPASESKEKPVRPKSKQEFIYHDSARNPLVEVTRIDKGDGRKSFYQSHWNGTKWVKGLADEIKPQIHLYRIQDSINQAAIATAQSILIVEGEGIVDLLLGMGIAATTSIGGAGKWRHYGYPNYLEDLVGANVVLCPDRDTPGLKHCEDIALDFPDAKWLYAYPDSTLWRQVDDNGGLDIANWVADHKLTRDQILAAIGDKRQDVHEFSVQPEDSAQREDDEEKPCKLARQFQEVQVILEQRLRLNTLKLQLELDGQPLNPDRIHLQLANDFNLQIPRANALDIVTELAERRSYSPVVEYLNRVYDQFGGNASSLANLAYRYFGTNNSIYDTYLQKTLVAAVARAMQPGCKMDTALILQGKQGVGKSTFFKILAGEDWFDDSLGHISDKDERLKLHVTWFIEWAELESVFKRRDLASVKAFLTCSRDYIRPPYGRSVQAFDRPSIIVGTTNQDEFLGDSTGNRRFWVIPVQKGVDLHQLQQERDRIWAAAVTLYKAGEPWWLSQKEEELSSDLISEYQIVDPWQEAIARFVADCTIITTEQVLRDCIDLALEKRGKETENRVGAILKQLGWTRERRSINGKQKRVWVQTEKNNKCRVRGGLGGLDRLQHR